ncbi:ABC transporter substrate-binding protein [Martelella alba]|uniref:Extracellular solute-binding protein n=1 Tax=Martelella alba TaxID=2590451 RepID=A0ABY2SNT3_9HYPH|nr:ABC transporter substrate-binding protein [Martelella alba]TKI05386.1 extracellular solute-binding protein [Martelella alba]
MAFEEVNKHGVSRRTLLKGVGVGTAAAMLGMLPRGAMAQDKKIVWGTNADYAKPELLAPFTQKTATTVGTQFFADPSELIAKIKSGGAGIDVLTDGSYHSQITYDAGILRPVDLAKLKNWQALLPQFQSAGGLAFNGKQYGIPYAWGTDSVVYNRQALGVEIDDIGALFNKKYAGQIAMPNGLFESLVATALYLGIKKPFAMDQKELDEVTKALIAQKPLVRTYWNDIGDLKNLMATGEVTLCWGWKMLLDLRKDGIDVQWSHPKQGELAWYDAAFVTTEASGAALEDTYAFLDYLIGDTYGRLMGEQIGYATTSTAAIKAMTSATRSALGLDKVDDFLAKAVWWTSPTRPAAYQAAWDKVLNA